MSSNNKKKDFLVNLGATAYMVQNHRVKAKNKKEAIAKALERAGDEVWHYVELQTEPVVYDVIED